MSARSPSGEQYEIALDDQRAAITEVGGGLRTYTVGGVAMLDGYREDELCPSGRGQVLAPWPNRIADGRYAFGGEEHQLPIDEPARSCAIHGLVRWSPWRVAERETHRVVLQHDLHPRPGYPFALDLRIEYRLSEDGLGVSTTATNAGVDPCPYGAGAHPYLLPGPPVYTAVLGLPARNVLDVDEHGLPAGWSPVDGSELDFREAKPLIGTWLDHCFTGLTRGDDGLARVTLTRPELGTGVTLWVDEAYPYLMLYTGDDRPDVSRHSLAVEPMTCPPQAFRSGEGVVVLEPGASTTASWGLLPSSRPSA